MLIPPFLILNVAVNFSKDADYFLLEGTNNYRDKIKWKYQRNLIKKILRIFMV